MIFTMKICPPQVNQKQTIVAEATGFVFVNPGTWALQGKSAAKNRTQNRFNAQCKLSRRRLNRVPPFVVSPQGYSQTSCVRAMRRISK